MMTLVIYDISDDRVRNRISAICKRFGLSRIQRSAFLGEITSSRRKELIERLRRSLRGDGNIQIFVICKPDFALRVIIGEMDEHEDEEVIII
ncbi:CRISPR-associated endoribonuclease Cas2 [Archaeoglobus fulgidus DSM 8774]|uniref:CRISPR-associated endoribonuclease Cas2 n=1 Tax=Archaeoglobus fulgidus DSM 8774 TaxID=1344584 RepID=A0A075WE56_ARCFL|nr:CRISPR-associated endonuclease Cas2 [Archaeoglobus fulgidus]AIG97424.1 CRISPR-associated endoribonuclease Cas2 [Archaeoglobus fulgidus DSM 8774]